MKPLFPRAEPPTTLHTTNLPMSADDTTISVAEFLEFEFYFELAQFLRIQTRDLNRYKQLYPVEFAQCARQRAAGAAGVTSTAAGMPSWLYTEVGS